MLAILFLMFVTNFYSVLVDWHKIFFESFLREDSNPVESNPLIVVANSVQLSNKNKKLSTIIKQLHNMCMPNFIAIALHWPEKFGKPPFSVWKPCSL